MLIPRPTSEICLHRSGCASGLCRGVQMVQQGRRTGSCQRPVLPRAYVRPRGWSSSGYTEAYFWFSLASKSGSKKAAKTMNMVSQLLPKNEISTVDQRVAAWRSKKTEPRKSARPSLPARKMETPSITKDKDAKINGDVEARLQQLKRIYEQGLIEK